MSLPNHASPLERGKRVKRLRNLANIDRKTACEAGGFSIATLKNWELGRYGGINDKGAEKFLMVIQNEGVNTSYEWLMFGLGAPPTLTEKTSSLAEIKKIPAFDIKNHEKQILHEIAVCKDYFKDVAYLCVQDQSMQPLYDKGDYVVGVKFSLQNIKAGKKFNLSCIIGLTTGKMLVKILEEIHPDNTYLFRTLDTGKELKLTGAEIDYLAPIIRVYKKTPEI